MEDRNHHNGSPAGGSCRPVLFAERQHLETYSRYFRSVLVGLMDSTHAAALVCPKPDEAGAVLIPSVEAVEYPILNFPFLDRYNRQYLLDRLGRFKPTILHGIWPVHGELLEFLSRELEIPYLLSFFQPAGKLTRWHFFIPRAEALVAVSSPIEQSMRQFLSRMQEQIHRISVGCYVEKSCCCFSESGRTASLLTIEPLAHLQDFEPLLQAIRHLRLDGFDLFLGILGSGGAEGAIRRRIRALGLSSSVTLAPLLRAVRPILAGADVYIHLKDHPDYNPAILDAMSMGLGICGSPDRTGGHLRDGENAIFFDPKDELSIYTILKKLLSHREKTRQLALCAQEQIRQEHQVSRMADGLLEIYLCAQQRYRERTSKETALQAKAP